MLLVGSSVTGEPGNFREFNSSRQTARKLSWKKSRREKLFIVSFAYAALPVLNILDAASLHYYTVITVVFSSSMSSGSNPEPAVNLSHGMFHSRLKTYLFSKSFPSLVPPSPTD